MSAEHQIFISYARPDRKHASDLYDLLRRSGFNPWIDFQKLVAGQNWDFEIKRALEKSALILVLVSENSIDRRGYLQREMHIALDKRREKLIDDIFIIPILLDDISIPDSLKDIHCIYASSPGFEKRLLAAVNMQIERLGGERRQFQEDKDIYWSSVIKKEAWDGLPGCEMEIQLFQFESERYPYVSEIGDYIKAIFLRDIFRLRRGKLEQSPQLFSYIQDKWSRTNTFDAHCGDPVIKGKVIGIQYIVDWYGAGAAHPNHHFVTFSFLLDPLLLIDDLRCVFSEQEQALTTIREEARLQLRDDLINGEMGDNSFLEERIESGTADWNCFGAFVFDEDGIRILFAPYQVASYADGPQAVVVSYRKLLPYMKSEFQTALAVEHLRFDSEHA